MQTAGFITWELWLGPHNLILPIHLLFCGHLCVLCRANVARLNRDHLDCVVSVVTLTPKGQQLVTFCLPALRVGVNGEYEVSGSV